MWRGTLSPRKVDVLIRGLPADSATRMAMNERQPLWSRTDFILADLVDATNSVAWIAANKEVPKARQTKFPEPYSRPGMAKAGAARTAKIDATDLLAFRERTRRE
jgi:hypothetical protein